MAPGLPCFLPQYLKLSALQYLSQHQLVVLKKKKKIWRSSRARSEAPAWRIKYVTKSPVRNFFPFISQRRRSVPVYNNKRDTNSIIFFDNRKWRVRHTLCYVSFIRHLHISHNAPYLPITRQISHNRFSFPLGITAVPREFENDAYAKFCGGKYGVLWGMYKWRIVQNSPYPRSKLSLLKRRGYV